VKKDIPYEAMKGLQTGEKSLYVNANGEKEIIDAVLFKSISYKGWLRIKFKERDYHATSIISIEQNVKTK
jgi:hypothetical protein